MKITVLVQAMVASLIFFPTKEYTALPKDYAELKSEVVEIQTSGGVKLVGWYLPYPKVAEETFRTNTTIYLLHGNAGNIGDRLFKAREWIHRGYSVFLLDYRGYGQSEGKITSEEDLYQDARAGLKWLREVKKKDNKNIVLYGESIGCAPVIQLAVEDKQDFFAVILEAPFTSLPAVTKVHYSFIPTVILGGFQFDNLEKISKVKTPVFVIHGEDDEICPFEMGKELFNKAAVEPKEFFEIPNGHHNDLPDVAGNEFYDRPNKFLELVYRLRSRA